MRRKNTPGGDYTPVSINIPEALVHNMSHDSTDDPLNLYAVPVSSQTSPVIVYNNKGGKKLSVNWRAIDSS